MTAGFLGLDLGGTNIKAVVLSDQAEPEVVTRITRPTMANEGPDSVAERLIAAGMDVLASHPVRSVGLGVPGLFDAMSGKVELFPNLPGSWDGFPLRDRISNGLGLPVELINDARAFTLAEGSIGAGKGSRIVLALVLGTGVGGGITVDGRLHLGAFGTAGEIGHQTVLPDGPLCGCGNRGCVEALTKADVLADLAGQPTAEAACSAAASGDQRSLQAIEQVANYLGIGLANAITILGPERIVIGGGIAGAGDLLLDPIRRVLEERVTLVPIDQIDVVTAELGSFAGAIGAGLAAMGQEAVRSR